MRFAALDIVAGVEAREVPSNDFILSVALVKFRDSVPIQNIAMRIKHDRDVIGHVLHHQSEAFFLKPHFFFGALSIGDIPDGTGDQHSSLCLQGAETDLHWEFRAVFTAAVELKAGTHRPKLRSTDKSFTVPWVSSPISLGNEHLYLVV